MGAKIKGAGSSQIEIEGVKQLKDVSYNIMSDRIEAGTFLCIAAMNHSNIIVKNIDEDHIIPIIDKLVFTSVVVGFAGLSVHAQVMAVIARFHLSLAPYIIGKAMHGIIAGLYMYIYFRFNPITTAVFEPSMSRSFAISSTIETVTAIIVVIACIFCAFGLYLKQNSEYKRGTKF